ncbi:MAG: hypothetical protein AUI48_05385 [Chloroflexi bacterium 13_1_40CM_2_68_14]|nr:MAG: hypothetical protein AUI48_05385 [Chloroflexi bacterium 13_1_40CM_2_68_14]
MIFGRCCALVVLGVVLACAGRGLAGRAPVDGITDALQLPDGVRPIHYAIDLELDPAREGFRGTAAIDIELSAPARVIWLHGRDLHVHECAFELPGGPRAAAVFEQVTPFGVARVTLPRTVGPGRMTLHFAWDAAFSDAVQTGLFRSRTGGEVYVIAEFLSADARRAFPGFDEPRFKTPFDVRVTVPAALLTVSNERTVEESVLQNGSKRVRFATTRPLPTYLLFVAAGPFDVIARTLPPNEVRGRPLAVRGIAPRGRGRELSFALETGAPLLAALERWLAIPFPYGKLDHVAAGDYPGAKENAGAILYGADLLLLDPEHPDEESRHSAAMVMAHEMAHQWFGALVTAPWFTDAWLNESFAQFLGYRIADEYRPAWGLALNHLTDLDKIMTADGFASARAIRRPVKSFDDIQGLLGDGFIYEKGMAVLATFERWIGAEAFRAGLREYVRTHADGTASADDMLAALSRAAGRDVATSFRGFVEKPGIPVIMARAACDAHGARVYFSERRYRPRGSKALDEEWQVPVCARFEFDGGMAERCVLVPPEGTALELPECPRWFLPDAGGIGYYRWTLAPPDQAELNARAMTHLSPAERLSVARNARAAQRAGLAGYAETMDTLVALAGDPVAAVAAVGMEAIRDARDHLLDGADRPLAETVARRLYRPGLRGDGFEAPNGEDEPARRRRIEPVRFLAEVARDPEVRREAARRGLAFADVPDGRFNPDAVAADLAALALRIAIEKRGPALYDALLPRLEHTEGQERASLVYALAAADSPSLAGRAGTLWRDPRLRPTERLFPALLDYDRGIMLRTYRQMPRDFESMAAAVPASLVDILPLAARELCDARELTGARQLLGRVVAKYPSMQPTAARALEGIEVCAAERHADSAAAKSWFERIARPTVE